MAQPQERKIPTSAGMETATETVNRINATRNQPPTANIPVAAIDAQAQPITLPEVTPPQVDVAGAQAAAGSVLDAAQADAKAKEAAAANTLSESDRRIRETMGILGTESQTRAQLEEQGGVNQFSQDVTQFTQRLRNQLAELDQFDLDNVNTLEQMRVDASKRDLTKRTYSAMSAEANIQNAVRRAGTVAQTRATIAAVEVAQGNLQQATEQVDKALSAMYDPIRQGLQMEMMFNERNYDQFTQAQKNASDMKMAGIQQELNQIVRIQQSVDDAISTGALTPTEAEMLASPNTSDSERLALSQLIKSRSAIESRNMEMQSIRLDMAVKAEQLAKLREPVVATRETDIMEINGTKQLVDTQTGEVIATFGSDVSIDEIQKAKDAQFVNTLDALKNHPGMSKAVGAVALARFTPFKADVTTGQVSDFTGSVDNIVRQLTLNTYAEAKEKGMTFGAMSEGEWDILAAAATKINTFRRERDDGSVYFATSEKVMQKEFDVLSNFGKMDALRKGANPSDIGVLQQDDGTYWTRNSDGSYVQLSVTPIQ